MAYRIIYESSANKRLATLPQREQIRIVEHINALAENPRPRGSVKLSSSETYRIRVGNYRVIYAIHDKRLIVLVVEIGDRKDVYRRK